MRPIMPIWRHLDYFSIPHPMQKFGYRYTLALLYRAIAAKRLNPKQIQTYCDFGAGLGGPSLATQHVFQLQSQNITLLEQNTSQARILRTLMPQATIQPEDGLRWLRQANQRFDFITAYMLGPDYDDTGLARTLLEEIPNYLTDRGKAFICSDVATMHVVRSHLNTGKLMSVHWLPVPEPDKKKSIASLRRFDSLSVPYAVVLSDSKDDLKNGPQSRPSPVNLPPVRIHSAFVPALDNSQYETEAYSLSCPFEWDYLQATLETFRSLKPQHPAISTLRDLLATRT
jgi:hypothetical protein